MALAFVVGPFVIAEAALNGNPLAFLHVSFDAVGDWAPGHDGEPLGVVDLFSVGILLAFRNGKMEARHLVVVEHSHFRFCTRAANQHDRISHCTHGFVCLVINNSCFDFLTWD